MPNDIFGHTRHEDHSDEILMLDVRVKKLRSDLQALQTTLNASLQLEITNLQSQCMDPLLKIDSELKLLLQKYTDLATLDNFQSLEEAVAALQAKFKTQATNSEQLKQQLEEQINNVQTQLQTIVKSIKSQEDFDLVISTLKEQIQSLQIPNLDPLNNAIAEVKEKIETLENFMNNLPSSDALNAITRSVANIKLQLETYEDFGKIQSTITHLEGTIAAVQSDLANVLESRLPGIVDTLVSVQQQITKLENLNTESELSHFHHLIDDIQTKLEILQQSTPSQADIALLQNAMQNVVDASELNDVKLALESLQNTVSNLPTSQELKNIKRAVNRILKSEDIKNIQAEIKHLTQTVATLPTNQHINELHALFEDIRRQVHDLTAQNSKLAVVENLQQIVANIKQQLGTMESNQANALSVFATQLQEIVQQYKKLIVDIKIKPGHDDVVRTINEHLESVTSRLLTAEKEITGIIENPKHTVILELYSIPNKEYDSPFTPGGKIYMLSPAQFYYQFFVGGTLRPIKIKYWLQPQAHHYPTLSITNADNKVKITSVELEDFTDPNTLETAYTEDDGTLEFNIQIGDKLYLENPVVSAAEHPIVAIFLFTYYV